MLPLGRFVQQPPSWPFPLLPPCRSLGGDNQDDALGGDLSNEDARKACLVLERNDWDQDYALADAASSLELGTVQHLNAMYSAMGSDVMEYCEAKLAES